MKLSQEGLAFAKAYDDSKYWHPSVTADTLLFRIAEQEGNENRKYPVCDLELLLVKRGREPYKGGFALPGGFCNENESLAQCAQRELKEETGLEAKYLGHVGTYSSVDRDPRTRVMTESFLALLPYGVAAAPKAGDDAAEALWFKVGMSTETLSPKHYRTTLTLRNGNVETSGIIDHVCDETDNWHRRVYEDATLLAFDHLEVICCGVEALRSKLYRTSMAFNWVPETFRLASLQSVFEAVMGVELLRTTLFEHIKPMLKRAENQPESETGLLEQLYTYNKAYSLADGMSAIDMWLA